MAITIIATRRIAIINSHNNFLIDNVLNFSFYISGENYTLYFLLLLSFEKKDRRQKIEFIDIKFCCYCRM